MSKFLLNTLCLLVSIPSVFAQSFTGTASFDNAQGDAWQGISVVCNISIWVDGATAGLAFKHKLNNVDIIKLRTRTQDIPFIRIPQNVINAIKKDGRADVEYDLYNGDVLISHMGNNLAKGSFISWDGLLRLPASEHYKQSTTDNGYKLYKSGALNIRNVKIASFSYAGSSVVQDYLHKLDIELTGANKAVAASQNGNPLSSKGSADALIKGQGTISNGLGSAPAESPATKTTQAVSTGSANRSLGGGTKTGTDAASKPWTQQQVNDYTRNSMATRAAKEQALQQSFDATATVVNSIGNYFVEQSRQKYEAKQRAEEAVMAADEEKLERERAIRYHKQQLRTNRQALVSSFNGGKVPLSSQKVPGNEIYFFCFSYNQNAIEDENMTMFLSNVFAITRHGDGTWPFTANLIDDIARVNKGAKVELSGFYNSQQEAEQKRNEFIGGINDLALTAGTLTYKGKKVTGSATTDFWGNVKQPEKLADVQTPEKKSESLKIAETDFWGNSVKPAKAAAKPTDQVPSKTAGPAWQ